MLRISHRHILSAAATRQRLFSPLQARSAAASSEADTQEPVLVVPSPRSANNNSAAAAAAGAGRSFEAHEQSVGMLFTLEGIKHASPAAATTTATTTTEAVVAKSIPPRLGAIVKATGADWQINEIPADDLVGEPVFLTKMPKGRWRKISGKVIKKVETDSEVPFSDPDKHFREMAVTFGSYVHKIGKVPVDRDVLEFSLYRESTPWRAVLRRMQKRLLMKKKGEENTRVRVESPKESFGCVTQRGRIHNMSAEELPHASRHYNINPVLFNPLGFVKSLEPSSSPSVAANRWRVMMRCVDGSVEEIEAALSRIATQGAPNYFPLRCFGAAAGGTSVDLAVAVSHGRFFDACRIWLQNEAERDPMLQPHYSKYLAADSSAVGGLLHEAAAELKDQRAQSYLVDFVEKLSTGVASSASSLSDDFCNELWHTTISPSRAAIDKDALEAAPAFFLWNLAASQRLYQYGARAAVGDFVSVQQQQQQQGRRVSKRKQIAQISEELGGSNAFSLDDVLVPLPSSAVLNGRSDGNNNGSSWYSEFYRNAMKRFSIPEEALTGGGGAVQFRKLILKPLPGAGLQYKIVKDPNSLSLLRTDLFVRQERRLPQTMSLEERFREPTLFNVSDVFRERMQPALHQFPPPSSSSSSSSASSTGAAGADASSSSSSSRCSVAVECDLPHDSHILPLLREAFLLRHLHANDMMDFGKL